MKKLIKSVAMTCAALVGLFVNSCKPEDINTTFEPTAAVATITATVIDAETGADVSHAATITVNAANAHVVGNMATITGNYDIPAQIVTVTANYNGKSASSQVSVNSLLAGGQAAYATTIIVGTPYVPSNPAKAVISYSVVNLENGSDVTAGASVKATSSTGAVYNGDKGVITIVGNPDIDAQTLTVTAAFEGKDAEAQTIELPKLVKEQTASFVMAFTVGVAPVTDPASATVHVTVFDSDSAKDVTGEAEISAVSTVGGALTVKDGKIVLTGTKEDPTVAAQDIKISAKYNGKNSKEETVVVTKCEAGTHVSYNVNLIIPASEPVSYNCIFKKHSVDFELSGTFKPTHLQSHSHDGLEWAVNESEFLLDVDMTWEAESGNIEAQFNPTTGITPEDMSTAISFYNLLNVENYKQETVSIKFKVSAYAMYTLLGTKTVYNDEYEVHRYQGEDDTVIAKINILSVATQVEPKEMAIPGHEGHYIPGHGHADVHGYSSNAGGGIIWAD